MRRIATVLILLVVVLIVPIMSAAQSASSVTVPRLIQITGVFQPVDGQPPSAVEIVTLSVYADADGGLPVWQERQTVAIEKTTGRFTLLLGASDPAGIPAEVFASGDGQWMSLLFERAGEREQARVRIASVPYALKASDAETLGGLPASAYLRAPTAASTESISRETSTVMSAALTEAPSLAAVLPGTTNFLAKYVNVSDVGNSAVYETPTANVPTGAVGIGTTAPLDQLHLRFTNTNGAITGLAVQNLGNTTTSYSGMLFYDQFGATAQFQGFNNVTHEYRINNIATNASINFMTGSVSRFLVAPNGNIGIGTNGPAAHLEVSSAGNAAHTTVLGSSFTGASPGGTRFIGRTARGTAVAPTAVQCCEDLVSFEAEGYGTSGFSGNRGGMLVGAAQTWTDTAQGTRLFLSTTPIGSTTQAPRMTITAAGDVGIGTQFPNGLLELAKTGTANVFATSFGGEGSGFKGRAAGGTPSAPTATQFGDELAEFTAAGYGTTGFNETAGWAAFAAENWTDAAQGTVMAWFNTPIGSNDAQLDMAILPNGNVGIGTPTDVNQMPTATDKLQVFGDIRVGTTGTNGCIKDFAGTGLIGTCSSDRRFKKDITPFGPVLGQLTALQPVHYFWRTEDFPTHYFGSSRAYGLIAQDVEDVLPELVVTGEDGFKAVDYTKLPLLTIQAVKELKAEKDALKQRVDELERLVTEMLAAAAQR